jgi:glycerol-3-phosphate acyltransferase PlsY
MPEFLVVLSVVVAYLLGSLPTGYLVARTYGVDIQKVGSGNIGATNVLRSVGVFPAIVVMLADPLKGALATLIPMWLGLTPWAIALSGLAVVLGNNFNIFLRLKGGKGIATSLGMFLPIAPAATLAALALALFTMALGRYVSLGSLVGMVSAPLLLVMGEFHVSALLLAVAVALLAVYRHRENIVRLAKGEERRFGERKG